MAHPPHPSAKPSEQAVRDHELDVWLEHAFGVHKADPEPVLHDLDD